MLTGEGEEGRLYQDRKVFNAASSYCEASTTPSRSSLLYTTVLFKDYTRSNNGAAFGAPRGITTGIASEEHERCQQRRRPYLSCTYR